MADGRLVCLVINGTYQRLFYCCVCSASSPVRSVCFESGLCRYVSLPDIWLVDSALLAGHAPVFAAPACSCAPGPACPNMRHRRGLSTGAAPRPLVVCRQRKSIIVPSLNCDLLLAEAERQQLFTLLPPQVMGSAVQCVMHVLIRQAAQPRCVALE